MTTTIPLEIEEVDIMIDWFNSHDELKRAVATDTDLVDRLILYKKALKSLDNAFGKVD